jgi:hypothetical protein
MLSGKQVEKMKQFNDHNHLPIGSTGEVVTGIAISSGE